MDLGGYMAKKKRHKKKGAKKTQPNAVRKQKKKVVEKTELRGIPKEAIINEIINDLDSYMEKNPELREKILKELSKNKKFREKLADSIVGELT